MKIYIHSTGNISPQHSLDKDVFFQTRVSASNNYFSAIEPEYDQYIDSKMIRRMSRIVRMSVAAALTCLRNAGIEKPEAILTATAYGCLEDSSVFLRKMIEFEEKMLSPTAFIQSTHNTVGAQIALLIKCHNYNNTIVHRSFSLENALTEAQLLLAEGVGPILLGATDEITRDSQTILSRFGLYRTAQKDQVLFSGNINGEGAAFFLLDSKPGHHPGVIIRDLQILYKPENKESIRLSILEFLENNQMGANQVDLVLASQTGNTDRDKTDNYLLDSLFPAKAFFPFKSLCGDYPTASGFALWLANCLLKEQQAPVWMKGLKFPLQNILIHHRSGDFHHSLLLISSC